jgi:hypothetical protein
MDVAIGLIQGFRFAHFVDVVGMRRNLSLQKMKNLAHRLLVRKAGAGNGGVQRIIA